MGFIRPELFWFLLLLIPVIVAWSLLASWRDRRLGRFIVRENWADLAWNASKTARFHKGALILLALALSLVAAARPWLGTRERDVQQRGVNILFALDISDSMRARDIAPVGNSSGAKAMNRLEYAKQLLTAILVEVRGHRVGLMPFAGEAFLQCPLTVDYTVMLDSVRNVDFDVIDAPGSDLLDVVRKAGEAFERSGAGRRILVLVSDGEDHSERINDAVRLANEKKITIYAMGIGTRQGAPLVRGDGTFVEDNAKIKVISRLNDGVLQQLASSTGGTAYASAQTGQLEPQGIIADLNAVERDDLGKEKRVTREERFIWPLALALFALAIEAVIPERRGRRREAKEGRK